MRWFDIEKHSDGVWACVEINEVGNDYGRQTVTTLISTHSTRTAATTAANQLNRAERNTR